MDVTREEVKRIVDFLRENPDMAREFSVVINTGIVERIDSFEKVMERHFEESSARFAALDAKFNELIREMHEGFEEARREREKGFEQAKMEREAGFAAATSRFEEHDRKFDAVIREMHEGFEQAKMEREAGFAAANSRFEEHDRKFDAIIKKMDDGFAAANRKFEEHDRKFEALIKKMDEGFAIASKERSALGNTLGRLLEDRVKDRTEDYAERVGWKISARTVSGGEEVDLLVKDGISFFVETKSHADYDALEQVVRKSKKLKIPGMLVGERIDRGVMKEAKKRKILCLNLYELRSALESGRIRKFYSK